jgi:hypothetical protein
MQKAARKRAIDDQMGQAFGMAARIGDGDCATLGQAEQDKSFEAGTIDHRFKVFDQAIERSVRHLAL